MPKCQFSASKCPRALVYLLAWINHCDDLFPCVFEVMLSAAQILAPCSLLRAALPPAQGLAEEL